MEGSDELNPDEMTFSTQPAEGARFEPAPAAITQTKSYTAWKTGLKNYLYREGSLTIGYCEALGQYANPDESVGDFQAAQTRRPRGARPADREASQEVRHQARHPQRTPSQGQQAVEREQAQSSGAMMTAAVQLGTSVLGALLGASWRPRPMSDEPPALSVLPAERRSRRET